MSRLFIAAVLLRIAQLCAAQGSYNIKCDSQTQLYDERLDGVRFHNFYRSKVARGDSINGQRATPKAGDMEQMLYSCALETKARELIASCPNSLPSAPLNKLDHNVFSGTADSQNSALRMAILDWATTYKGSLYPMETSLPSLPFYMMMNAETNEVGCAVKQCGDRFLVACYYGEELARRGKSIYYPAQQCKYCPEDTTCRLSEGLCRKI